jgi:alkylated DNA repair dioxygenase AlkB
MKIYRLEDGLELYFFPDWVEDPEAAFTEAEKLSWTDEIVTMYAKANIIRRRTVDYGLAYSYNKTAKPSIEWEPLALRLKAKLEAESGMEFAQCACNEYVDGEAYIGPHHDKDTVVCAGHGEGHAPCDKCEPLYVASISLGATRTMVLTPPGASLKVSMTVAGLMAVPGAVGIDLTPGSLVLFSNSINRTWKHSIPKAKNVGKRISLTYRHF